MTMIRIFLKYCVSVLLAGIIAVIMLPDQARGVTAPLKVCATVPELGSLAREIGGDQVAVTVFAKGTEDAHFVEAKPSFIKALSQCELYLEVGLELELGWAPVLLAQARNSQILPGAIGHLDVSTAITPLDVPSGSIDRSMGDVHPRGNPHYLLDPLNGLKVARLIKTKLSALRPQAAAYFDGRLNVFVDKLSTALIGPQLAAKYPIEEIEKLMRLYELGKLAPYLESQGETELLGGWLGTMRPHFGAKVIDDHAMWPYFAHRFGIQIIGHLEPRPGIPPTMGHLQRLIEQMRTLGIKVVITAAYYDPRHAQFITKNTGAIAVPLAHMAGARPGTEEYLGMIDYNVRQLALAFQG
jgi:zinc/manganese transport system substrate-binding protein